MKSITQKFIKTAIILLLLTNHIQAAGQIPEQKTVTKIISEMNLKEKVGQLFIIDLKRLAGKERITEISPELKEKLEKYHFGGVALFAENLNNKKQISKLIKDIRATEKIPMFICVDEEGGRVSRLQHTKDLHLPQTPTAAVVGKTDNPDYAEKIAKILATQLKNLGFNVNFYPVADINSNPLNPIIGKRSFANNPEKVSKMVTATIKGLQNNDIMATAKHFPGHGDTQIDTHKALAIIKHNFDRLRKEEFIPFKAAVAAGVKFIMLAHIATPQITGNNLPATFSSFFTRKILRQEFGFKGIIITDAMMMKAITNNFTSASACIKVIEAGVDIILMPDNIKEGYEAVLEKAKNDKNFSCKIDKALNRILTVKLELSPTQKNK